MGNETDQVNDAVEDKQPSADARRISLLTSAVLVLLGMYGVYRSLETQREFHPKSPLTEDWLVNQGLSQREAEYIFGYLDRYRSLVSFHGFFSCGVIFLGAYLAISLLWRKGFVLSLVAALLCTVTAACVPACIETLVNRVIPTTFWPPENPQA